MVVPVKTYIARIDESSYYVEDLDRNTKRQDLVQCSKKKESSHRSPNDLLIKMKYKKCVRITIELVKLPK